MEVWIITWVYGDLSNNGIVGVYADEQLAQKDLELLETHGDLSKTFSIVKFSVEGE